MRCDITGKIDRFAGISFLERVRYRRDIAEQGVARLNAAVGGVNVHSVGESPCKGNAVSDLGCLVRVGLNGPGNADIGGLTRRKGSGRCCDPKCNTGECFHVFQTIVLAKK